MIAERHQPPTPTSRPTIAGRAFALLAAVVLASAAAVAGERRAPELPRAAHEVLYKAWQQMEAENFAEAIRIIEAFREQRPGGVKRGDRDAAGYFHPQVDFFLANCHLALGRPQAAVALYEHALSRQPALAPAWVNLGRAAWEAQRFGRAARAFVRGYELGDDKQAELLYNAALALRADGRPAEALATLGRLLNRHGDQARRAWHELQANLCLKLERPRDALVPLRILAQGAAGERQRRWREVLLATYLRLEMHSEAQRLVRRLTREEPEHPGWWREAARMQLGKERHAAALTSLILVDCLEALSVREARLAGDLSLSLEVPALAGRYYSQALEQGESLPLYLRLVQSYRRLHQPERALETVRRARTSFSDADLQLLEGEILFDLERYEAARKVLVSLVERSPKNGRGWLLLGYAASNLGDYPGARTALEQAVCFPGQRPAARRLIEQIDRMGVESTD